MQYSAAVFTQAINFVLLGVGILLGIGLLYIVIFFLWQYLLRRLLVISQRKGILLEIRLPKEKHSADTPNEKISQEKTKSSVAEQMFAEIHSLAQRGWRRYFFPAK